MVFLFLLVVAIAAGLVFYNSFARQQYRSQVILAKELRKAMDAMMWDLRQAKAMTVKGVPADGQWRHEIIFDTVRDEGISYLLNGPAGDQLKRAHQETRRLIASHMGELNIRRQAESPSVLEVQIKARNETSLMSNFKIRMQD